MLEKQNKQFYRKFFELLNSSLWPLSNEILRDFGQAENNEDKQISLLAVCVHEILLNMKSF